MLLTQLLDAAIDIVEQVQAWEWLHGRECAIDPDPLRLAIESFTMEPFADSVRKRYERRQPWKVEVGEL